MSEQLDIDDLGDPHAPEHAPAPPAEVGIVVATGALPLTVPLVDSKWTAALRSVIAQVKGLVVKDQASLQLAVTYQDRLTQARKQLEAARKAVKAPFLAACRAIDAAADVPEAQAAAAVESLRRMQIDFAQAEKVRVAKEEKARQDEIARLKKIADDEAARQKAEADRLAEEAWLNEEADKRARDALIAAGKAPPPPPPSEVLDIEEDPLPVPPPVKSEAQIKLEQAMHAPAPKVTTAVGVQMRTTLIIASVDVARLPDPFITKTANLQALRAAYCDKWNDQKPIPVVEGVTFEKKELPVTRGSKV